MSGPVLAMLTGGMLNSAGLPASVVGSGAAAMFLVGLLGAAAIAAHVGVAMPGNAFWRCVLAGLGGLLAGGAAITTLMALGIDCDALSHLDSQDPGRILFATVQEGVVMAVFCGSVMTPTYRVLRGPL